MFNDKCSMINDKGFALITVMFILATLISVVFIAAYPLVSEPRNHTRSFITNEKFHRYKRALLGRLAEQCGGKFISCGGHVSDYPEGGGAATAGDIQTRLYGKRLFKSSGTGDLGSPSPFQYYNDFGFWSGYRGKRYVYPLPSDDWHDDWYSAISDPSNAPQAFLNDYGWSFFLRYGCAQVWNIQSSTPQSMKTKTLGMWLNAYRYIYIMVKDHSKENGELRIILVKGCKQIPDRTAPPFESGDYILHTFKLETASGTGVSCGLFDSCGLTKLLIQVNEGGDWVTKFTKSIVVPPYSACQDPDHTYRRGAVCITVGCYG
ncbi:MAG: hypothetical protein IMF11_11895 [Proteobacteria bacterium]|nr:hypothetical protein [Pseudomonadota bacterium]